MSKAKNSGRKPEAETTADTGAAQDTPKAPGAGKLTPLKKISVKEVCGTIPMSIVPPLMIGDAANPEPNPDKEIKLCRIAGFASGTKTGTSTYGPWQALLGEFAATSYLTGELFASKTALIPGAMGEALFVATENALAEDASAKVRFSIDVSVSRSPREPDKKYVYHVRPVIEAELGSPALALLTMGD